MVNEQLLGTVTLSTRMYGLLTTPHVPQSSPETSLMPVAAKSITSAGSLGSLLLMVKVSEDPPAKIGVYVMTRS